MSFPLSKSKLQSHHQCNKKLWLEVHQPKLAQADEFQQLNLDRGTAFGEAVRSLYPDGILVAEKNSQDAIAKTQHHLETFAAGQKPVPLFEAAFSYNNVVVRVDVLIPAAQSAWELIEVKTGQLKPHYVRDAATQALVITKSNPTLTLTKICVGTPNRDFVYTSQNDYRGILTVVDVTNDARALFEAIASDIEPALRTLNLPDAPERTVGGQCTKPYACGFTYHCTGTNVTPEDRFIVPVWHLASSPLTKIVQKLLPKTRDLAQVDDCELIDATHRKMKEVALGKPYYLDPALQNFLSAQPFPRYFLDYEYTTPPIPLWLGTHPNERIAFQFSVHVWTAPDAPLEHFEFLASSNQDPRSELAQKLIEAITTPGSVFAWSGKQVEGPITEELCKHYPAGTVALKQIANSCRANDPLTMYRQWMYFPEMKGDWGLKSVAKSILSTNPYDSLSIKNGVEAMKGYNQYLTMTQGAERTRLETGLKLYCGLDTAVMVDIWKKTLSMDALV